MVAPPRRDVRGSTRPRTCAPPGACAAPHFRPAAVTASGPGSPTRAPQTSSHGRFAEAPAGRRQRRLRRGWLGPLHADHAAGRLRAAVRHHFHHGPPEQRYGAPPIATASRDGPEVAVGGSHACACPSAGKSTLMNQLFGTDFSVMDAMLGRSQTTQGVWLSYAGSLTPPTLVCDLEGTDGRERGEDDTAFEKQSALFALATSDVLLINMCALPCYPRAPALGPGALAADHRSVLQVVPRRGPRVRREQAPPSYDLSGERRRPRPPPRDAPALRTCASPPPHCALAGKPEALFSQEDGPYVRATGPHKDAHRAPGAHSAPRR
eukprot:scaffold53_cov362-Prasinococcus_capsulatus_cf.AAC.5